MNSIGTRTIVTTCTLLFPLGESASIEVPVGTWRPRFVISFVEDGQAAADGSAARISLTETSRAGGRLTLHNFTNVLPMATTAPLELGKTDDGRALSLMLCNSRVGNVNRLDLQFFLEGLTA